MILTSSAACSVYLIHSAAPSARATAPRSVPASTARPPGAAPVELEDLEEEPVEVALLEESSPLPLEEDDEVEDSLDEDAVAVGVLLALLPVLLLLGLSALAALQ